MSTGVGRSREELYPTTGGARVDHALDDAAALLVGAASVPAQPADGARLDAPVAGVLRVVNSFRAPTSPWAAGHRGVDLAAAVGTEVLTPATGTVSFSGVVVDRGVVTITHPNGLRSSLELSLIHI